MCIWGRFFCDSPNYSCETVFLSKPGVHVYPARLGLASSTDLPVQPPSLTSLELCAVIGYRHTQLFIWCCRSSCLQGKHFTHWASPQPHRWIYSNRSLRRVKSDPNIDWKMYCCRCAREWWVITQRLQGNPRTFWKPSHLTQEVKTSLRVFHLAGVSAYKQSFPKESKYFLSL